MGYKMVKRFRLSKNKKNLSRKYKKGGGKSKKSKRNSKRRSSVRKISNKNAAGKTKQNNAPILPDNPYAYATFEGPPTLTEATFHLTPAQRAEQLRQREIRAT